jgi:hypothetical protein
MAWNDLVVCMGDHGNFLVGEGQDAIERVMSVWDALRPEVRTLLVSAAIFGETVLRNAFGAVQVDLSEGFRLAVAALTLAGVIAALVECWAELSR